MSDGSESNGSESDDGFERAVEWKGQDLYCPRGGRWREPFGRYVWLGKDLHWETGYELNEEAKRQIDEKVANDETGNYVSLFKSFSVSYKTVTPDYREWIPAGAPEPPEGVYDEDGLHVDSIDRNKNTASSSTDVKPILKEKQE